MSETAVVVSKRPELVQLRDRQISTHGWRVDLAEEHLKKHLLSKRQTCTVECLARTMFGRNTPTNREAVRNRMANLYRSLLRADTLLIVHYHGHRGCITGCELYDRASATPEQRAAARVRIERMEKRGLINQALLDRARALM